MKEDLVGTVGAWILLLVVRKGFEGSSAGGVTRSDSCFPKISGCWVKNRLSGLRVEATREGTLIAPVRDGQGQEKSDYGCGLKVQTFGSDVVVGAGALEN